MTEVAKQEEKPTRSIVRKLAEVTRLVDRIAKRGQNTAQNYNYVTEADILDAVRTHMAERNLVPFPHVREQVWETLQTKSGGTKKLCTFTVDFRIEDGDSGEVRTWDVVSQGEDTGDKAAYKAITGAEKYALLKVFMIPTGDDPEKDAEKSESEGLRHTPRNDDKPHAPRQEAASQAATGAEVRVPYGKSAGKLLSEITEKDLSWLLTATTKSVNDPSKARFKEANQKFLEACQAEAAKRKGVAIVGGKVVAPPATSPRQAELPVNEDDGEEIVTPSMAFARMAREFKMSQPDLAKRAAGALHGKQAPYTHEDLAIVRTSLEAVPNR